jgi:EmrB/QacA subfamily drug resistance transporter
MATATAPRLRLPRLGRPDHVHPTLVLAIILACYLMVVVDTSVVITALPEIRDTFRLSSADLSWVQNAYTLTFGGLLLLGARAGDILGRRRVFVAGIGIFTATSLLAGLAQSAGWLLAARAGQGVGAAIATPATLALLTTTFAEGPVRTRAIAAYAAVAGAGGSVGLVLGGFLTDVISWRWGMFINVPLGIALMALAPVYLPETERHTGRFDLVGAATSTLGMSALVFGFVHASSDGWGDRLTLVTFAVSLALLALFVRTERRAEQPITPLRLFASRERSGAYLARVLVVGGMISMFFFVSQYLQLVQGKNALESGLAFLPMTLSLFGMVQLAPRIVRTLGPARAMVLGLTSALIGMAWLSRLSETTAFFPGIALPLVLLGVGMGIAFTPLTASGVAGVAERDAGAGSGLVNAAQQLGGSLGLAVLVAIASATAHADAGHPLRGATAAAEGRHELADSIAAAVTGATVLYALAIGVVLLVIAPAVARRPATVEVAAAAPARAR